MKAFSVTVLLLAGAAVHTGGTLFIKGGGASMFDKADRTGKKTALNAGDEVTWNGPSEKDPSVHEIVRAGKKGFVSATALTANRPVDEVLPSGQTVSAQVFAAAAVRPLEGAALMPSGDGGTDAALIYLSGSSEQAKRKVAEHAKQAGLEAEK